MIVHGRGPSDINLGIIVCLVDVYRALNFDLIEFPFPIKTFCLT